MVAGAGFEPRDLRVMSPTSYLAALPRDKATAFAKLYYSIRYPYLCQPFLRPFKKLVRKILIVCRVADVRFNRVCDIEHMVADTLHIDGKL